MPTQSKTSVASEDLFSCASFFTEAAAAAASSTSAACASNTQTSSATTTASAISDSMSSSVCGHKLCDSVSDSSHSHQHLQTPTAVRPASYELSTDMCFASRAELKSILEMMAIRDNWEFICVKSNSTRYTVRCKDPTCNWYLHSSRPKSHAAAAAAAASAGGEAGDNVNTTPFVISVYRPEHTCIKRHDGNSVASSPWIARRIITQLLKQPKLTPHDIIRYIYSTHGITISYKQAWRAKDCAIQLLRARPPCYLINDKFGKFCQNLELKDPSARAIVDVIDKLGNGALLPDPRECNFRRMFWTFGAAINGITYCRPVIALGRIERLRNSNVVLLVATTRDAEDQQFPVAFAFTRFESSETWTWFLSLVREALVRHMCTNRKELSFDDVCEFVRNITFVSDYRFGLDVAVNNVFPDNAQMHALCLRYLYAVVGVKFGTVAANAVMRAAAAHTQADFDNILARALSIERIEWIVSQWPPSIWAESHFRGKRFGILDANMARLFVEWDFVPGDLNENVSDREILKCPALDRPSQRGLAIYSCPCIVLPADQVVQRLNVGLSSLFSTRLSKAKNRTENGRAMSDFAEQYVADVRKRVKSHIARVDSSEMGSTWRVRLVQYPDSSSVSPSTVSSSSSEDSFEKVLGDEDPVSPSRTANLIAATTDYAREYVVDLSLKHCSCMAWTRTGLPCEHVLAVVYALKRGDGHDIVKEEELVDEHFLMPSYMRTYEVPIEVIACE